MSPLARIAAIARNTLLEALRQRVLNVILVFGLVVLAGANLFSEFSFDDQFKFIKDYCLGVMSLIGVIMAIVAVAQLLPAEMEGRTIFTILSKPVRRWEFLMGKYLGVAAMLLLTLLLMAAVSAAVLFAQERALAADARAGLARATDPQAVEAAKASLAKIAAAARDPWLLAAVTLVTVKVLLVAGIALAISTIATSMMFTVVVTSLIYIAGHLESTARAVWLDPTQPAGPAAKAFLAIVSILIPDLGVFNLIDEIVVGNTVTIAYLLKALAYAGGCLTVVLLVACALFESREL